MGYGSPGTILKKVNHILPWNKLVIVRTTNECFAIVQIFNTVSVPGYSVSQKGTASPFLAYDVQRYLNVDLAKR